VTPAVRRALANLDYTYRYPDTEQRDLRAALEKYTGVPVEYLLAGNGSDELLSLLSQVILEPGDSILLCPPTFAMYPFYARLRNCNVINVPRKEDLSVDVDQVIATAQAKSLKVIYIDSPGNPASLSLSPTELDRLLELPSLIVLDEAYIEFANVPSRIIDIPKNENLIVLRTFSKWAGLAGFRVGYGAFPKWLVEVLWQAKSPYNVTTPAMVAGIAALDDLDTLEANIKRIITDRIQLAAELLKLPGLTIFPSETNFLLVRVEPEFGKSASDVCEALKEKGVLIRTFESMNCVRITIGTTSENQTLLQALGEL